MNAHDVANGLSYIVLNTINFLNDRVKLRMDIEAATKLGNDIIKLLMNEHTKKVIRNYISWCLQDE